MPRRLAPAALLACLFVAACATALTPPGFGAPTLAAQPVHDCNLIRVATAPLQQALGVWVVPVDINGTRLRLVLDTGAERTLLTEAAVARIGMLRDPHHQTRTLGIGGQSTAADGRVSSFAIGGAYIAVPSVTVGQFALLDGLLGADVLSAFDVDLDARDARLTLYLPRDCPNAGPPWREPYFSLGKIGREHDRLLVPIVLDGAAGTAAIDTGAQHTVVSERLAERAGATPADMAHDRQITAHGAGSGQVQVRVHRFRQLRIGPADLVAPLLPVLPMPEGQLDGLVGDDFLAGRRVWLSYASMVVFITASGAPPGR
jgi:predicted aspartyl protease